MQKWNYSGPHEGLYYGINSSGGIRLNAATRDAAEAIVQILNDLEERAAFAEQINQDHCENAFVESTLHKQVVRAASAAVIAFGSETEADAIHHLGQVLAGNVYSLIKEPIRGIQFFVDTGDGVEYHDTAVAAKKSAEDWIAEYRTLPEWDEAVERVCWGVVREYAMPRWHGENNEYATYELKEPK